MVDRLLELTERVSSAMTNWREIIEEINSEWERASTTEQRVSLLAMFKAIMDIAETTIAPEDLEKFREARARHYSTFVVQEALVGTNVCVETLFAVTEREITAGRMLPDHTLRQLAVKQMTEPHLSRAELEAQAAIPTLCATSIREMLASIEQLTSSEIAIPWQDMTGAIKSLAGQDFTAEEWYKVVDFAAFEFALWQCKWLFSSQDAPNINAKGEAGGWEHLSNVFLQELAEKVPGVADQLLRKRNLIVAQLQIQRKVDAGRGSQVARITSATMGTLARASYSVGLKSLAQGLMKRALYPAGTVGRVQG
jgi:hypothetical protein